MAIAKLREQVILDPLELGISEVGIQLFSRSFEMTTPAAERKRPVGQPCTAREHRQMNSGKMAVASGYQMRRGLVPPVFEVEMEPCQAAKHVLEFIHPFTVAASVDKDQQEIITQS